MPWSPDPSVVSLIFRITGKRKEALEAELQRRREAAFDLRVHVELFSGYARRVREDVLVVLRASDGSLAQDRADWARRHLESNFDRVAQSAVDASARSAEPELHDRLREAMTRALWEAKRDLAKELTRKPLDPPAGRATPRPDPAFTDDLTHLGNRRAFDDDIRRQIAAGEPFALVWFDIDKFKDVNDQHGGHLIGDEALRGVADVAAAVVKGKGRAYRFGGDEFALVLPNHIDQEALAVAQRLRTRVAATPLTHRSLMLTLSIGIGLFPDHGRDGAALIAAADKALYHAKHLGRDLVRVFGSAADAGPEETERG
jgi:diguanylate cyclase (GGDEF)-like protein